MISGEMQWILDEGTWVTWRRLSLVKICFNVEGEEASKDRCLLLCENIMAMRRVVDDGEMDRKQEIGAGGEKRRRRMKQENRRYREALRRC